MTKTQLKVTLLKLANKLDEANNTSAADHAEKIAQMLETDDTQMDWETFDAMHDSPGELREDTVPHANPAHAEDLAAKVDALKAFVEEGMASEEDLRQLEDQVEAMLSAFMGGNEFATPNAGAWGTDAPLDPAMARKRR